MLLIILKDETISLQKTFLDRANVLYKVYVLKT